MDSEVPGAGCSPGRKQKLQWVQGLAFKWSPAQKKCGEHGPSPAGASRGPSWALGCCAWMELTPAILTFAPPLPAPDTHLQLLPFHFILGCYKNTAKKFSEREKPAKCYFLPLIPLRLPLLHVLFTISWRWRASFYMQPIKNANTRKKSLWEGFSSHDHGNNGPCTEQRKSQGNTHRRKWIPGSSLPGMSDSVEGT